MADSDMLQHVIPTELQKGLALIQSGNGQGAMSILVPLLPLIPEDPGLHFLLGMAYAMNEQHDLAAGHFDRVIAVSPNDPSAYVNKGIALRKTGNPKDAIACFDKALELAPDFAEAYCSKANALSDLKMNDAAIIAYQQSIVLDPENPDAQNNVGLLYADQGAYQLALAAYQASLKLQPNNPEAYQNLGNLFSDQKQFVEALRAYAQALALKPDTPDVYHRLGNLHAELKNCDVALAAYAKALELKPDDADVYNSLGNLQMIQRHQYREAIAAYRQAMVLNPDLRWLSGMLLHAQLKICDWDTYTDSVALVAQAIQRHEPAIAPFAMLGLPLTLLEQKSCAEIYVESELRVGQVLPVPPKYDHERIKIAYLSADYHNHATAYLMAELFELHDRSRFEVIGICYGRSPSDEMRQRVAKGFDQFIEVADKSDQEIANLIRELEIDIAIDLKGHTQDNRLGILAYRPAPIQLHYLGYPGTIGAPFIDYLIADPVLIPPEHQAFYTEKIVYLPDTYQVNDRMRKITLTHDSRMDHGLPEQGFVFCCFNNNWKITPEIFNVWVRILQQVDGSVLWLFKDNDLAAANLIKEAQVWGIAAERLIFAEKQPLDQHLARLKHADLFLDTLYYNAHTTASDALWGGLPVLTKLGETYASRVAASLLNAIGLPELITHSLEEYEGLAVDLGTNAEKLEAIKRKLAANRLTTPLFDTPRFTKHLEAAYERMVQRYRSGGKAQHIYV